MRIAAVLSAAVLVLVGLAVPVLAHHRDGHAGGPPSGAQQQANKEKKGNGQSRANRVEAKDAQECKDNARNHGQYVSCVAHLVQAQQGAVQAQDVGLDSDCDSADSLIACAAHSDVGKAKQSKAKQSKAKSGSVDDDNDED